MDVAEIKRLWRDKNTLAARAVPVEIAGVGTVYVRVLMVADQTTLNALAASTDDDEAKAIVMAGLLCDENGERPSPADLAEFTELFKKAEWSDYIKMTKAAGAGKAGDDAKN